MLPRHRVYSYPWELMRDGDPTAAVEELAEAGVDTLSVCPVYHRVRCVMPRNRARRTFIADRSYAYFSPAPDRYRDLELAPAAHPDPVERSYGSIVDAARRRGLGISAWIIALHYSPHFSRYRGLWTRNVWGEPNPESVCPSNPDVPRYLAALSSDVREQFRVEEIELETPHWDVFFNSVHGIHERIGVSFDPVDVLALSLCFCAACTAGAQQVGVDVEGLRAHLVAKLDETLRSGRGSLLSGSADDNAAWVADCLGLPAFLDFRRSVITRLVATVQESVSCPVSLMYDPWDGYALDATALGALGVGLTGLTYSSDSNAVRDRATALMRELPGASDWRFVLSLFARDLPAPDVLRQHIATLVDLGVSDIGYYNSSLAAGEGMSALRQALTDGAGPRRDLTAEGVETT